MEALIYRCERCRETLNPKTMVCLELHSSNGTFHIPGTITPESQNQGGFFFGRSCAKAVLDNNGICEKKK